MEGNRDPDKELVMGEFGVIHVTVIGRGIMSEFGFRALGGFLHAVAILAGEGRCSG